MFSSSENDFFIIIKARAQLSSALLLLRRRRDSVGEVSFSLIDDISFLSFKFSFFHFQSELASVVRVKFRSVSHIIIFSFIYYICIRQG